MKTWTVLLPCSAAFFALADETKLERRLPDPSQTFNLYAHFLASGEVEGALALTYSAALTERAAVTARYRSLSARIKEQRRDAIALDHKVVGDLALVHMWDHSPNATRVDIDPAFLIRERGVWKLLPVFTRPKGALAYLDEAQNKEFTALMEEYLKEAPDLKKKYAEVLKQGAKGGAER
jgi:hypothetical protein